MATMTNRRVIKLGYSLVITLPKAWTDYYKLKAGDTLHVTAERTLNIKPKKANQKETGETSLQAASPVTEHNEEVNPHC